MKVLSLDLAQLNEKYKSNLEKIAYVLDGGNIDILHSFPNETINTILNALEIKTGKNIVEICMECWGDTPETFRKKPIYTGCRWNHYLYQELDRRIQKLKEEGII